MNFTRKLPEVACSKLGLPSLGVKFNFGTKIREAYYSKYSFNKSFSHHVYCMKPKNIEYCIVDLLIHNQTETTD